MKDHNPHSERRKQRRLEEFGTNHPICLGCLFDDHWTGFEIHHLAGRAFNAHFIWHFCSNCHDWLSERQKGYPKPSSKSPDTAEIAGHVFLNVADIFALILWKLQLRRSCTEQLGRSKPKDSPQLRELGAFVQTLETFLAYVEPQLRKLGLQLVEEATRPPTPTL